MKLLLPNLRQRLAGFISPPVVGNPFAISHLPSSISGPAAPVQAARSPLAMSLPSGMSRFVRPESAQQWGLLPQLGSITPQFIEQTLRGALAGAHVAQWELFNLMKDTWPRLLKNEQELKRGALSLQWEIEADAAEDEAPTPEALERVALVKRAMRQMRARPGHDENGWDGTLADILDAWTVGTSVLEVLDWREVNGDLLPRATYWVHPSNYAWAQEGFLGLASGLAQQGPTGRAALRAASVTPFPDHKFLVAICKAKAGHPLGGALLRPLAWWWCAANFSAEWLLNFAQVFGMPIRWAHYPAGTPQATIDAICAMLQNMGHNAWAAFPEGAQVELKESSKGATGSLPQEGILDRADKQCDLLLLGQTLTSDTGNSGAGGGSLALGQVHAGVRGENIQSVANFGASVLNEQLIPSLLTLNYGDTDHAPRFHPEPRKVEDKKANAERDAILLNAGVEFPKAYFHKRHEIPLPQDGEEVIGGRSQEPEVRSQTGAPVSDRAPARNPDPNPAQAPKAGLETGAPEAVAASSSQLSTQDSQLRSGFAAALADDLRFALDRLARISEISDPALFEAKLREFAQDFPQLKADVLADPKSARALLPALVKGLEQGLGKPAVQSAQGHEPAGPPDGGQFASGDGGGGESGDSAAGADKSDPVNAIGKSGNWQTLGLPRADQITPDRQLPHTDPTEAEARLQAGFKVTTALRNVVTVDARVLKHWDDKKKTPADKAGRLRGLDQSVEALRNPHEVWDDGSAKIFIQVTRDDKKQRVMHAFELKDGSLESYYSTSKKADWDKKRKGTLLYVR